MALSPHHLAQMVEITGPVVPVGDGDDGVGGVCFGGVAGGGSGGDNGGQTVPTGPLPPTLAVPVPVTMQQQQQQERRAATLRAAPQQQRKKATPHQVRMKMKGSFFTSENISLKTTAEANIY